MQYTQSLIILALKKSFALNHGIKEAVFHSEQYYK